MSLRVANKNSIPDGGWWNAVCPWDGKRFHVHHSWAELVAVAKQHCLERNYPIPLDFEALVEGWVCHFNPDRCHEEGPSDLPLRPHTLGYDDVLRGTKVWATWQLAGQPLVAHEEAERRSAICSACPLNVNFTGAGCGGCGSLEKVVIGMIGERRTQGALFACAICHCFLRAAVWLPLDIQCRGVTEEMKVAFRTMRSKAECWKICE